MTRAVHISIPIIAVALFAACDTTPGEPFSAPAVGIQPKAEASRESCVALARMDATCAGLGQGHHGLECNVTDTSRQLAAGCRRQGVLMPQGRKHRVVFCCP